MKCKRSTALKKLVVLFVLMLILVSSSLVTMRAFGQTEDATNLAAAENAVLQAFVAVQSAQNKGANVTELVAQLNAAVGTLVAVEIAFRNGANASQIPDQWISKVNGITASAIALGNEADTAANNQLNSSLLVAGIGLSILFVVSILGWMLVKSVYVKRTLRSKPMVVEKS